jgi:hypothetical protein
MVPVTIILSPEEALVLYEALERLDESEHRNVFDEAEWMAVWAATGQLESQNIYLFDPQYSRILEAAKRKVAGDDPPSPANPGPSSPRE